PVGSNQSYQVDCQIIAATHKDLTQLVETGQFRQDLYYRLNGLIFTLPNLSQRQDKRELIEAIYRKYAESEQTICSHLMSLFCSYPWPGNIRELDNLLKVSALMSSGEPQLKLEHVPLQLAEQLANQSPITCTQAPSNNDLQSTVEETLVQTYQANQGNISKTSRVLGISRNTIYRKLKRLGILQ
ncbi:sigma 54-interacting transcriptional regulator, partial [Vibrio fortis]